MPVPNDHQLRFSPVFTAGFALCWSGLTLLAATSGTSEPAIDWAKERQFWAFQQPKAQARPSVKNKSWSRQPLDHFVLAKLEQKKLAPSAEADRRTLIRRANYDLAGLPPTPAEVDAFLADKSPQAYEHLVDRLLASPRFGERLASLWLPLARYAEDQAHQVGADTKFFYPNAYKYREWVINAFNRDLPYDQFVRLQVAADKISGASADDVLALGFLGLGPKYYNRNRIEVMADEWEDRVDTVTRTILGLTVACARCHDHKFEPITQRDYYAMAGVFASTRMLNRNPAGPSEKEDNSEKPGDASKMSPATQHIVEDDPKAQDLNIFLRGNPERKGDVVERSFLRVLSKDAPTPFKDGSGRRELAESLASRANPLTARVIVNRVWGAMFGRPLVATPSNFGHSGERPTHPELLDDLAARFMDSGWSVKALVREMATSATYRQSSVVEPKQTAADPDNSFLSRMNRRRMTVEQWRDGALFVGGQLDFAGGKSLELDDAANKRRTVHARVSRLKLNDFLMLFDYPDANVHAEKRSTTTTATQKLFLLNNPFAIGSAKSFAARVTGSEQLTDEARVQFAYKLLFGREPEKSELALALEFVRKPAAATGQSRWEQWSQLLFASNEFLYVD
ncbi:MAG: DUF1549 domain-containing protein [Verrucomicrobia bacterium]|nr:DUF1549 domain-containing protein [Verrucomicrobiota bacterium]